MRFEDHAIEVEVGQSFISNGGPHEGHAIVVLSEDTVFIHPLLTARRMTPQPAVLLRCETCLTSWTIPCSG